MQDGIFAIIGLLHYMIEYIVIGSVILQFAYYQSAK